MAALTVRQIKSVRPLYVCVSVCACACVYVCAHARAHACACTWLLCSTRMMKLQARHLHAWPTPFYQNWMFLYSHTCKSSNGKSAFGSAAPVYAFLSVIMVISELTHWHPWCRQPPFLHIAHSISMHHCTFAEAFLQQNMIHSCFFLSIWM